MIKIKSRGRWRRATGRALLTVPLAVGLVTVGATSAVASTSAHSVVVAPAVPPPGTLLYNICPHGSMLCLAPRANVSRDKSLRLVNVTTSRSNREQAEWIMEPKGVVKRGTLGGVTKQWETNHLGYGIYVIRSYLHQGLCLGKTSLTSVRLAMTRFCGSYIWVWKQGHEMFSFHYGNRKATPGPAPFCISIFGARPRTNSTLSLALVGEARVQKWSRIVSGRELIAA